MTKRNIKKRLIENKIKKDAEPDFIGYINAELAELARKSVSTVKRAHRGARALCRSVREDVNAVRERDPAANSSRALSARALFFGEGDKPDIKSFDGY